MHTEDYTLCRKNLHPFSSCDIFVRFHPILLIFGRNIPQDILTKHLHGPIHISFHMFVLYLVKTSDAYMDMRGRPRHIWTVSSVRILYTSLFRH